MDIDLPRPIAAYLAAEKAKDSTSLARCFDTDGVVRDEGREHHGVRAIEAWHRDANAAVRYVVEALSASESDATIVVHTRVSGDFPGSPAELRHRFTLNGDRIALLEVAP